MKKLNLAAMAAAAVLAAACTPAPTAPATAEAGTETLAQEAALQTIMTRTSVRTYQQGRAVEPEKVEAMLRAGMAAPTAVNRQPWHFVVVDDTTQMDALAQANGRPQMIKAAPLAIVVCGDLEKTPEGPGRQFWIQDCSAATENILLAAHALGLGAVWTALYPMGERYRPVQEALQLPSTMLPLCTIVIGYPDGEQTPKDKYKPENVSRNVYGQR